MLSLIDWADQAASTELLPHFHLAEPTADGGHVTL
jgi:hypothetical protein